jgi:hypothetical protein
MEVVYNYCITGFPISVISPLKKKISQLKKNRTRFKVGSTSNPQNRSKKYDSKLYKIMYIVYESGSISNMMKIEEALIDFYEYDNNNDNLNGGCSGPAAFDPESYYVYVIVGKKKKWSKIM